MGKDDDTYENYSCEVKERKERETKIFLCIFGLVVSLILLILLEVFYPTNLNQKVIINNDRNCCGCLWTDPRCSDNVQ